MTARCSSVAGPPAYQSGRWEDSPLRPGGVALTARALELCGIAEGARVLDLGCGSGEGLTYLRQAPGVDVVGIDISPSACRLSLESRPGSVVCGCNTCLPFADESMDAVVAECVLSLVEDQERALAECSRVLRKLGCLAITDMYARNADAIADLRTLRGTCVSGMHVRSELEGSLARQDFAIEAWEDHSNLLKQMVARFVMEHGSVEQLWASTVDSQDAQRISQVLKNVRPGYFLAIARKVGGRSNGGGSRE
jgi:arsenite methyltransferase